MTVVLGSSFNLGINRYSRCNLLFPWANSYYCMRKSVFLFYVICVRRRFLQV